MGDEDFTPLVTPFAITSLEQQERVLRFPAARNMLRSLGRPGLQGIALLPGELRYPAGVTRDAVRPADFRGATVEDPRVGHRRASALPPPRITGATMIASSSTTPASRSWRITSAPPPIAIGGVAVSSRPA